MQLDKAIEICRDMTTNPSYTHYPDKRDAIKLGIEALKVIERSRQGDPPLDGELLPGETEE